MKKLQSTKEYDRRNKALRKLGYGSYQEFLRSPYWNALRSVHFLRPGNSQCFICKSRFNLHAHHQTYERIHFENATDLITLCDKHHKEVHDKQHANGLKTMEATKVVTGKNFKKRRKMPFKKRYNVDGSLSRISHKSIFVEERSDKQRHSSEGLIAHKLRIDGKGKQCKNSQQSSAA